jgi:ubiquinone biosynthesis protein UbiJ
MDDIHRKRLEWVARYPFGEFPAEKLFDSPSWGKGLAETAKAALDEIDRLNKGLDRLLARISKLENEIEEERNSEDYR